MPLFLQSASKRMLQLALLLWFTLLALPLQAQTKPKPPLPQISAVNYLDLADYQAKFETQSVPFSVVAGEKFTATIKFTNLGNLTWNSADKFRLGSQSPANNVSWTIGRVELPNSVPKGSSVTFTLNATAPLTAGKVVFQWQMLREDVVWFGDFSPPITIDVLPQRRSAKYDIQTVPASVASGAAFSVPVTMTNTGNTTWKAGTNYNLGAQNPENNRTWVYAARVIVPRDVAPNENVTFAINATAPSVTTTQNINFQWRMVQDPVEWFGDFTPNVVVQVTAPVVTPTPTPTPTPIPTPPPSSCPSTQAPPASGTYTAATVGKTVYGNNAAGYTSDSDIPRALVHSGLLQPGQSAFVTITNLGYLSNFLGTTANGITSSDYGPSWCAMRLSVAIPPPALPTITASHSPATLVAGQTFSMTWSSTNASSISYSCSNGGGLVLSGSSQSATGTVNATALAGWVNDAPNCTWTATGGGKSATSTDRLTTSTPPPATPVINSVSRSPATMTAGSAFTVNWSASNATSMAYTCTPNSGSSGYNGSGSGLAAIGSTSGTAIAAWGGTSSTCVWTAIGAGGATATYRETVTTNTAPGVEVVTYIHTDGLGSPVAKSDANGNLIAGSRTRYEPYGATSSGAIPTIGFTGHVNDANTGLVYMQQRYYDPYAGRFLSTDPVLTDANTGSSFNRYVYANNSPYKYIDRDGREAECSWRTQCYKVEYGDSPKAGPLPDLGSNDPGTGAAKGGVIGLGLGLTISGVCDFFSGGVCVAANPWIITGTTGLVGAGLGYFSASKNAKPAVASSGNGQNGSNGDKQKKGKPERNVDQNKQVNDAARDEKLTPQQRKTLGRAVENESRGQGSNLDYHDIREIAKQIKEGTY